MEKFSEFIEDAVETSVVDKRSKKTLINCSPR